MDKSYLTSHSAGATDPRLNQYSKGTCEASGISEKNLNKLIWAHIELLEDGFQKPKVKRRNNVNMKKELEISRKRRHNWMMALGDGNLSSEDYAALIDGEDARIRKLQEEALPDPEQTIPLSEVREAFKGLDSHWDLIDPVTQKQIVQSLFRKITIKKSDDWHIVDMLTV